MNLVRLYSVLLLLACVGCNHPVAPKSDHLPKNAKITNDLGNGWVTFELEVDGRKREILYHLFHHDVSNNTEAFTELSE